MIMIKIGNIAYNSITCHFAKRPHERPLVGCLGKCCFAPTLQNNTCNGLQHQKSWRQHQQFDPRNLVSPVAEQARAEHRWGPQQLWGYICLAVERGGRSGLVKKTANYLLRSPASARPRPETYTLFFWALSSQDSAGPGEE